MKKWVVCLGALGWVGGVCVSGLQAAPPAPTGPAVTPEAFPAFHVPGAEAEMAALRAMFLRHFVIAPDPSFEDPYLPMSLIWVAAPPQPDKKDAPLFREIYRQRLLVRRMADGYVETRQHRGMAHKLGWPFPLWQQMRGIGWHFSLAGNPYGQPKFGLRRLESAAGWTVTGVSSQQFDAVKGWVFTVPEGTAVLTTPVFSIKGVSMPFVRCEWSCDDPHAQGVFTWSGSTNEVASSEGPRIPFCVESDATSMIEVGRRVAEDEVVRRFHLTIKAKPGATVRMQALMTAADSRHNVNNAYWLGASLDFLDWTGDLSFLRENLVRMRAALDYLETEFKLFSEGHVITPWVGHDGRSGLERREGRKIIHHGLGIGNNYWDLIPFGGRDAMATLHAGAIVRRMAVLEALITENPGWGLPAPKYSADELRRHADRIKADFNERFWNPDTGRFGAARDLIANHLFDYGFTFVNLEAIHYGMVTPDKARMVMAWINGARQVAGDTSQGADIYHWRMAPRATTVRNIEYYSCVWSGPESIPWGGQVQDGGAVLGFSFYDIMARLRTHGADDAWHRLRDIAHWYDEVRAAGGYREYYREKRDGATLQGGGTAGGLGLDYEFFESVMVPQVLLYGFMGFQPGLDALRIAPALPAAWPTLGITHVRYHGLVLDTEVSREGAITLTCRRADATAAPLRLPAGVWALTRGMVGQPGATEMRKEAQAFTIPLPATPGAFLNAAPVKE